jgi:single-strand DNA-binding protein
VWGKLAELCNQYLEKGRQVYLEGRLQTRSWDDKNGQKRYTTEINATTVQFIGDRSGAQAGANRPAAPAPSDSVLDQEYNVSQSSGFTEDDIPF